VCCAHDAQGSKTHNRTTEGEGLIDMPKNKKNRKRKRADIYTGVIEKTGWWRQLAFSSNAE